MKYFLSESGIVVTPCSSSTSYGNMRGNQVVPSSIMHLGVHNVSLAAWIVARPTFSNHI